MHHDACILAYQIQSWAREQQFGGTYKMLWLIKIHSSRSDSLLWCLLCTCLCPVPTGGATQCKEDIAWSSSDSQQSEDEDRKRRLFRVAARQQQHQQQRRGRRPRTLAASVHPSRPHPGHVSETGKWKYERWKMEQNSDFSCFSWTWSNGFSLFNPDDVPAIDTDSDVGEPVEPVEVDSGQQISDFDSESCQENPEPVATTQVSHVETPSFCQ